MSDALPIGDGQAGVDALLAKYGPGRENGSVRNNVSNRNITATRNGNSNNLRARLAAYIAKAENVGEGSRNSAAFRLAGGAAALIDTETGETPSEADIIGHMRLWNGGNSPPLSDDELASVVRSAMTNGTPRAPKPDRPLPPHDAPRTAWQQAGANVKDALHLDAGANATHVSHSDRSEPAAEARGPNPNRADVLTGSALADYWRDGLDNGFGFNTFELDTLRPNGIEGELPMVLGGGLVSVVGGRPGAGKSALAEQLVFYLLRKNPTLRALIANVELSPAVLIARQLTRLTGISTARMLSGTLWPHERQELAPAFEQLAEDFSRLTIVRNPRELAPIVRATLEAESDVVLLDYIQRLTAGGDDARTDLNAIMHAMRWMADQGKAVLAISALSRGKGAKGSTYSGADLASFRESGEVEYGADYCAILDMEADGPVFNVVKHRFGRTGRHAAYFKSDRLTWQVGGSL